MVLYVCAHGVNADWAALANEIRKGSLGRMLNLGKEELPPYNFDSAHRAAVDEVLDANGLNAATEDELARAAALGDNRGQNQDAREAAGEPIDPAWPPRDSTNGAQRNFSAQAAQAQSKTQWLPN